MHTQTHEHIDSLIVNKNKKMAYRKGGGKKDDGIRKLTSYEQTYVRITPGISCQHPSQSPNAKISLKSWMFWQRSVMKDEKITSLPSTALTKVCFFPLLHPTPPT